MSNRRVFSFDMNIDDLYEDWIDDVVSRPLINNTSMTEEVNNALRINQQLISNMYQLRRQLEMDDTVDQIFTGTTGHGISRAGRNNRTFNTMDNNFVINNIGNADGVFELFRSLLEVMIEPAVNTEMEDIKVTLTEAEFDNLSCQTITECSIKDYENKDCNVCIEGYKVGECVVTLPCEHYFHKSCIHGWLCQEKVTCPVCRHDTREQCNPKECAEESST
uniref:RING-type domain-containing protein n=1 Tax=viral metagenome TaxID=1070528 RepID=A0A6C0H6Z2_9ZZZZ